MSDRSSAIETPPGLSLAVEFGVSELTRSLQSGGVADAPPIRLAWASDLSGSERSALGLASTPQAYALGRTALGTLLLAAHDDTGLMYACLDLAEQIEMLGADFAWELITARACQPDLQTRGLYTFLHHSEAERDWLYDPQYWQDYADELARCRFNRFNLIYGHQSPHLIPIYAFLLDDLDDAYPTIRVEDMTRGERQRNLQALQAASAAMASRDLRFFLGIWQSRPWTMANGVWETQPTRVTGTDDLALLTRYTRDGFKRLIERCPHIGGIQLRMNIESGVGDQRFFVEAFAPALQELAAEGRPLQIELRNWGLQADTVAAFRATGLDIVVSTKYFAEHQALPYQPPSMPGSYSYDSFLRQDKPFPFQWHVWNLGSHRLFRWGDPDYVKRFARSCHLGDGVGFEVTPPGSQKGFSQWGEVAPGDWQPRSDLPAQPDYQRYWFFHHAFGRLTYDPTTPDAVFAHQLARRTSPEVAPVLLDAYRAASQVVSYLISQRMDDRNMYCWPELDCGGPIDHHTLAPPGEVTLFKTAREHAADCAQGHYSAKKSPLDCARDLERMAEAIERELAVLGELTEANAPGGDGAAAEIRGCAVDFAALAGLARYHAAKSRASGNLALFYASGEQTYLDEAQAMAQSGIVLWDRLCELTEPYHGALHLGPTGGHWRDNKPRVRYDLERIRRVRELFDRYGLMARGFDLGAGESDLPANRRSGLRPEPRFIGIEPTSGYSHERGFGWLQPTGMRSVATAPLDRDLLWGVFTMQPELAYDPTTIEAMPTDGLIESYITGLSPHVFRVDLPNGEYRVTMRAPKAAAYTTPVRIGVETFQLGAEGRTSLSAETVVRGGTLELTIGGFGPWALSAIIICHDGPFIAHLPPLAYRRQDQARIRATVTAVDPLQEVQLRFAVRGHWFDLPMQGDGKAFVATLLLQEMDDLLTYEIVATTHDGHVMRRLYTVPIVDGFRSPAVTALHAPGDWTRREPYTVAVVLEHGNYCRELRLHYREADQNRPWRMLSQQVDHSGEYRFAVDTRDLDDAYELLTYIEVCDILGSGSFAPDPFIDARYRVAKPTP